MQEPEINPKQKLFPGLNLVFKALSRWKTHLDWTSLTKWNILTQISTFCWSELVLMLIFSLYSQNMTSSLSSFKLGTKKIKLCTKIKLKNYWGIEQV